MKLLLQLYLVLCLTNCNAQTPKSKKMQLNDKDFKAQGYQIKTKDTIFMKDGKLDIARLEKVGSSGSSKPPYYQYEAYLKDIYIYIYGSIKSGFGKTIKLKPEDDFRYGFSYYPSGELKGYGIEYPNSFKKGVWYDYDIDGKIIKDENYDAPYEFSWEDVKEFLRKENIKKENLKNIYRGALDGVHGWEIIYTPKEFQNSNQVKVLTLDPKTGAVVKTETRDMTRHLD